MSDYLSYGAGVGSTALICYMLPQIRAGEIEVVYVNHGADLPENIAYVQYIKNTLNIPITEIKPDIGTKEGRHFDNLYDYYVYKRLCPSIHIRSCTTRAKIQPFNKYISRPATVYLGITYDEKHRAKPSPMKYRNSCYPLVDAGIGRTDAVRIIKDHNLAIPEKSSCYFCPFQTIKQWMKLYENHPDLFYRAVFLEKNCKKTDSYLMPSRSIAALEVELQEQTKLITSTGVM